MKMHDILIIDDFLTESECDELVTLFESSPLKDNQKEGIWKNRVKWPEYPDHLLLKIKHERQKVVENHFQKKFKIDNLNMTLWEEGHSMPVHSDFGAQNEFPMRNYASLIYLNRDFEGGKLYIPELNFELSPKKGQLVTFEGGRLKHGVTKITKGRRITSICWFKI
jgi:predicted 2-oxoglutarate/Fe(II)-dependent dioxygenase YbiX